MEKIQDGYYWLFLMDCAPEIVEVSDENIYRCGRDIVCFKNENGWEELGDQIDIVALVGPLMAPPIQEQTTDTGAIQKAKTAKDGR